MLFRCYFHPCDVKFGLKDNFAPGRTSQCLTPLSLAQLNFPHPPILPVRRGELGIPVPARSAVGVAVLLAPVPLAWCDETFILALVLAPQGSWIIPCDHDNVLRHLFRAKSVTVQLLVR
jgi:hypothetical protein